MNLHKLIMRQLYQSIQNGRKNKENAKRIAKREDILPNEEDTEPTYNQIFNSI